MSRFRQAAPDPGKAERDGVTAYIPSRSQPNTSHKCQDCDRTATWEFNADGVRGYACGTCRTEYAISATNYSEKRIR